MAMELLGENVLSAAAAVVSALDMKDTFACFPTFALPHAASFSKRVANFGCFHQFRVVSTFSHHQKFIHHVHFFASTQRRPDRRGHCNASRTSFPTPFEELELDNESVPKPRVIIDQDSDPYATVVELSFGDRLGALLDTVRALKELGLNVVKGTVSPSSLAHNKFSITRADTGRKVEDPELLEAIRLSIISNLLQYHPESSEQLAMGEAFGIKPPKEKLDINVATHITIKSDGPKRSLLTIKTADRPGLLMEIVKIISDTSVAVESGEVETEGLVAKDKLHVSYQGAALSKSMEEVLTNCLRYYLRRPETNVDSY